MDWKVLNKLLFEVVERIEKFIPRDRYESVVRLISVEEQGIAFDHMCSYGDDFEIPISRELFKKIEIAGQTMKLDPKEWTNIEKHISG